MNNNPFFNPIATTNNNQQEEAVLKDIALFDVVGCLEQRWKDHNYHIYDCGRERLISEDDDEKRIEKYVEEQYSNDCGLAKQWIKNDLKKQKKQQKVRDTTCRHGELDLSLLSTLDENVKFDILEFIPTYSKWKAFIQEGKQAKYLDVIKFPRINDNDSNQGTFQKEVMSAHEYRLDLPFITFHKMRLICKRFNTRMMRRILQTTELIVCNFSFTIITYFATFLRMQRLFKENNDKLPTDSIYLYSDQMLLSINFQNTPSQPTITLALSQPSPPLYTSAFSDGFSPFPCPLLPINTGLNYPAHANCINENDTDEEEAEEGDSDNETTSFWNGNVPPPNAININNILYGNSLYSLPNFNNDRTNNLPHDSDTNELTPKFELKPRTPMYFPFDNHAFVPFQENRVGQLYYALEPLVCSSFIGENTTLQSLIIMAAQPGMSVTTNLFPYLKALKNLMIWGSDPRCDISSSYVQQVVMINMDCDNACELFPKAKIITQYVTSGGLSDTSNHSIIQKKDASELIDVLQSMESRIVMKLMDENGYPQQIVLTMGASELFLSSVIRLAAEKNIQRTKSFVAYLIKDLRYPCEQLNLFFDGHSWNRYNDIRNNMTPAVQCILQYIVYLCNEYQNGRILSIPKAEAEYHEEVLLLLLSYGWNCWTQKDELFYVMCSYLTEKKQHTVLKYLLSKFCSFTKESDLEMFVYSWMVHCCIQNRKIALDCILSHFLHHHEEMLLNVLIKPVLCCKHRDQIFNESGNHIPLVGLLFSRCHSFGGFLLQTIFESMSEKQFKQLVVKETKETILHIFLMTVEQTKAESLDVSLLFTLIRKNPKWLHAKNILNDTPLTLMQRVIQDSYLRFRIEKEFGRKRTNNGSNPKEGNRRKIERE